MREQKHRSAAQKPCPHFSLHVFASAHGSCRLYVGERHCFCLSLPSLQSLLQLRPTRCACQTQPARGRRGSPFLYPQRSLTPLPIWHIRGTRNRTRTRTDKRLRHIRERSPSQSDGCPFIGHRADFPKSTASCRDHFTLGTARYHRSADEYA